MITFKLLIVNILKVISLQIAETISKQHAFSFFLKKYMPKAEEMACETRSIDVRRLGKICRAS